ncbi:MAG TPA: aminotransferase class V-fold PLP-dependent enzyme [Thermoanaerobaculia bacterium]|nr:aminotransferase class V-fold PLP-dependent enzyme [Thermoanaerobaculia bacterium]
MDIDRLRSETPGCQERIHLNNAGSALMPEPVVRAIQDHIALESRIGGYEAHDERRDAIEGAYRAVAELLASAAANIAFTDNATASFMQALSSIPFRRGDVILTTRNDYISNQIQFLSLEKRLGVEVVRAPDAIEGGVDAAAMADLIRLRRPMLVCVTHVPTNSGLVQDVAAIGAACREHDVLYLIDACQSIGQMPIDVNRLGCDYLSASSRKFLRGPRGAGFLYVSDRVLDGGLEPLFIDMRGADWIAENRYRPAAGARRFETWEFAWALVLATGEAARYATAIGLEAIRDRARSLAERLRRALAEIEGVRVLDRGRELCAIVTTAIEGRDPAQVMRALRARRINTTAQIREHALIDYDDKGVAASLRLSPHYYNTEDEIDRAVVALRELLRQSG